MGPNLPLISASHHRPGELIEIASNSAQTRDRRPRWIMINMQQVIYFMEAFGMVDAHLMIRVASQEKTALAELYDRHSAQMLAVALRILNNRRDAEDLVHDVFLEIWRKAKDYDPERGTVRSWILTRVRSRAIDRIRALVNARKHMMAETTDSAFEEPRTEAVADNMVDGQAARDAITCLSEPHRDVVMLSYFEGLTCREISERCAIPLGTVKSRLAGALARLRLELKSIGRIGDGD